VFPGALERRIQYLVLFCVLSMTLVVTPWANLDPINLPKFVILGTCGFVAIGNVFPFLKSMIKSEARVLTYGVLLFLLVLIIAFLFGDAGMWAQVYGVYGRNTGLVAYVGLALMLESVVFVSRASFVKKLMWVLIFTGVVNAGYGLIQWSGNDPVNWNNPYDPIVGTLGNPNFVSAHLGIAGLAALALIVDRTGGWGLRLALVVDVVASLFVIAQSSSSQGLLVFALGATVILFYRFLTGFHAIVRWGYWLVVGGFSVVGVMGILNKGPLASFLYQESVTYRGDYWRAGWKMTLDNPLFGVGLDSYGDWYRFSRTEAAALRRGPDVTSNSAHNVFLDISSNGGFLLLGAYLLIIGLIVRSGWRVLRRSTSFDAIGVGLVSAWLAYLVQSIISINQLGLAIWGWVLGGAIIGYDLYRDNPEVPRVRVKPGQRPEQVPAAVVLTRTLGLVIGFVVSVWPMTQDLSFRKALEGGDALKLESATKEFPRSNYYYVYSSQILLDNKVDDKALELARLAISSNPRDFNAWKMLVANPKLSEAERASAMVEMKKLDPFNNTLDKK
jgi:O-antigen ligase